MNRKEYMDAVSARTVSKAESAAMHQTYYAQFCPQGLISAVVARIGAERILASTGPHMNDIPLQRWDDLAGLVRTYSERKLREANGSGGVSLSDCVCTAKAAARIFKDSNQTASSN